MRKTIRVAAAMLALLMLVLTAVACGNTGAGTDATTAPVAQTTAEPDATTDKYEIGDNVPGTLAYNGEEINIISRGRTWTADEVSVSEENGEPINDAVFKRNQKVEDRLGVKIINTMTSGTDNYEISNVIIRNQINSDSSDYDLLANSVYASIIYTGDNLYADLSDLEYLDLTREYWSQGFNEAATIGSAQYFVTGAICLSYYRFIFATFFNRRMFADKNVEYPYQRVTDQKWTLDYQYEITAQFYDDVNGDNLKDENDVYGFVSNADMIGVDSYWSACKLPILTKDNDNMLVYSLNIDRTDEAVKKINKLFWENIGTYNVEHLGGDTEQEVIAKKFSEGTAAMVTLRLIEVEGQDMREMADDYGIVPMPKLDENQDDYYSSAHDTMTAYAIPNDRSDEELEMIGAFLEVMASESYRYVTTAYYELALKSKYVDDPESVAMLDIITQNLYIDPGVLYTKKINSVHQQLRTLIGMNKTTTVSYFEALKKSNIIGKLTDQLNTAIEKTWD